MSFGVAILASVFPPSMGGIQNQTLSLSQALCRRGVEVHVITRKVGGAAASEVLGGVQVHRVGPEIGAGALKSVSYICAGLQRLSSLRGRVQVVHAQQLLSPSSIALVARSVGFAPVVLNPHACGSWGEVHSLGASWVGRARLRAAVRLADAFVAISQPIHAELRSAGVREGAIWDLPNGVDTSRFHPALASERRLLRRSLGMPEGPLAVYAGRLSREKGVDVLLEAWGRVLVRRPQARLWILGEGDQGQLLRSQATRPGLRQAITFTGAVSEVPPYLRAADLAVLPSRTEGLSVAALEAMACGLPLVATAVGGTAHLVEDGVTGRLVPADDPAALAGAVCEGLDKAVAARWGENARGRAVEGYSIDRIASELIGRYQALLGRGGT